MTLSATLRAQSAAVIAERQPAAGRGRRRRQCWSRCRRSRPRAARCRTGPGRRARPRAAGRPPRRPRRTPFWRRVPRDQRRHPAPGGLLLSDAVTARSPPRGSHHIVCTFSAVPVPWRRAARTRRYATPGSELGTAAAAFQEGHTAWIHGGSRPDSSRLRAWLVLRTVSGRCTGLDAGGPCRPARRRCSPDGPTWTSVRRLRTSGRASRS
jgi:hypothetical protein